MNKEHLESLGITAESLKKSCDEHAPGLWEETCRNKHVDPKTGDALPKAIKSNEHIEALAQETLEMVQRLHSVCDGARTKDFAGFSSSDVNVGWALAGMSVGDLMLTTSRLVGVIQLLRKYSHTQIGTERFEEVYGKSEELRSACLKTIQRRLPQCDSLSEAASLFDQEVYNEIQIVRDIGSDVRKAAKKEKKDLDFAASTRSVSYTYGEEIVVHWDRKDFQYKELYDMVKALPFRSWNAELTSWVIPFAGNTQTDVNEFLDLLLGTVGRDLPEGLDSFMAKGTWTKEIDDQFGIDVVYGKGSHAGRMELVVNFPAHWEGTWKLIGLNGEKFKDELKNDYGFKFKGEAKAWTGTLTLEVFNWLYGVAAKGDFEWTLTERAEKALRGIRFLSCHGNYIPQKATNPHLEVWKATNGWSLREYQIHGIKFIRSKRASMILDDMGSGKTCQALMSLHRDARAIIVVPASLIPNWQREAALWRPEMKCFVGDLRWGKKFLGSKKESPVELEKGSIMLISNARLHDKEAWDENKYRELRKYTPDSTEQVLNPMSDWVLIADECKAFKNQDSQRTQYMAHWANEVLQLGGRVCGMDGTPITKDPKDLYIQQNVFGLANICWESYEQFVEIFGGSFTTGYSRRKKSGSSKYRAPTSKVEWDVTTPDQEAISDQMRIATLRRNKADLMPWLPPQQWQDVVIESTVINSAMEAAILEEVDVIFGPETAQNRYARSEFVDELVEGHSKPGAQAGVMSRLRKLLACSKVNYVAEEAIAFIRSAHFSGNKERLVIMTTSAQAAEQLGAALDLPAEGIRPALIYGRVGQGVRDSRIRSFQGTDKGAFNVLVCTIGAAGQGINLTAADTIFFVDWDWSHAMNEQAEARTHRSGLESDKALYVNFIVNHWLDLLVAEACGRKKNYHQVVKDTAIAVGNTYLELNPKHVTLEKAK